jgi:hypothetical protein
MNRDDYVYALVDAGFVLSNTLLNGRLAIYRRSFNSVQTEGLTITDTMKVAPNGIEHHRSYNYRLSPTRNYELKVTCWLFSDMEFVDRKNLAVRRNKYPFRKYD